MQLLRGKGRCLFLFAVLLCVPAYTAHARAADQYVTWGVDIEDCSEALNEYLNNELTDFLEDINDRDREYTAGQVTLDFLFSLRRYFHASRLKKWLRNSPKIDRYPDNDVSWLEYQKMSIYRRMSFPYLMPIARTIRVGDVYLGIDKIGHFVRYGHAYFRRYRDLIEDGLGKSEAVERVLRLGIKQERLFLGGLVCGVFSYADLEANYRGFCLARDMCEGDDPYIEYENGRWKLARPIDIRDYVTPGFDESYNNSRYWFFRWRKVKPVLEEVYCPKLELPAVKKRFKRYKEIDRESLAHRLAAEYFEKHGEKPQQAQNIKTICRECEN